MNRVHLAAFALLLLLTACGGSEAAPTPTPTKTPQPTPTLIPAATPTLIPVSEVTPMPTNTPMPPTISVNEVLNAFTTAGIAMTEIAMNPPTRDDSPLPRSFNQHAEWKDTILGDKGGQVFVCDTPELCRALSAYFEAMVALAGPYIYTSPSGLVVVQVNKGFTPEQAARYQAAIGGF